MLEKIKIAIILPFPFKTGGTLVVLEYVRQLQDMGHPVDLYMPLFPYRVFYNSDNGGFKLGKYIKSVVLHSTYFFRKIPWFDFPIGVNVLPSISGKWIRIHDVIISTAWPTAYSTARLPGRLGKKFYFVQHYEKWSGPEKMVNGSYKLPLKIISISPWLTKLLKEKFDVSVFGEVHNGVNTDFFKPGKKIEGNLKLLFVYNPLEFKGGDVALKIVDYVQSLKKNVDVIGFGLSPLPLEFNKNIQYTVNPENNRILELYQKADIFLFTSLEEGWGMPVMEAMACGCAVITSKIACTDVLYDGQNMLLADAKSTQSYIDYLDNLIADPSQIRKLGDSAFRSVQKYSSQKSAERLLEILKRG